MPIATMTSLDLSAVAAYPASPQIDQTLLFVPDSYRFQGFASGAVDAVIDISFDGVNTHLQIRQAVQPVVDFITRAPKIWAKRSAGTGTTTLQVTPKSDR